MTATPPPNDPAEPTVGGYPAYPGEGAAPPAGPGGYPSHPGAAPVEAPQPGPIRLAVRLMRAGAVVSLLSLVVGLSTMGSAKDDIREELTKDDPNVSQSTIDAAYAIGVTVVVVAGALGVLLWLWMAWKNGQGRSWARIVATVLGCLNAVFMLLTFAAPSADATALAFSSINLVLAIAILVLLWRKESSDFYASRSRPQYA